MRRRRPAQHGLAVVFAATLVAACDTSDGREMQTPDSVAVWRLQSTTPSTTTTVPVPSEIIPATTALPTQPSTTRPSTTRPTTTTSSPESATASSGDSSTPLASDAPDGSSSTTAESVAATDGGAAALGFPDLAAEGLEFTGPWEPGGTIDASYTCDGEENEPLLTWTAPPDGTVELALLVLDEDPGYVHWLVVGLPARAGSIGGGEPLAGGTEANNSSGEVGWVGPCPPAGDGTHTYRATLYALDQQLEVPIEAGSQPLVDAISASAFGVATFTGTYERA